MNEFTSPLPTLVKRIAESTVRRLSVYLRFLEDSAARGRATISSEELARHAGTTSAQVRKDLSFFGSFGKRGLGYSVPELTASIREILGLERDWNVVIVGAGKLGGALAQNRGFGSHRFRVVAIYDVDPEKIGRTVGSLVVRDFECIEADAAVMRPDIAVLVVTADAAQDAADRLAAIGLRAILNFAPVPLQAPPRVAVRSVNLALELEGLSFELSSRGR